MPADRGGDAVAPGWRTNVRRITELAWPVTVGQVAVLGFATVDTLLLARQGATDLAALAIGSAAYTTIFVGLMGIVLAIGPIAGRAYGAGRLHDAGRQVWQAGWLAVALSVAGGLLLAWPTPFLALSQASPEVEAKVRAYLGTLALALPAALLFTVYRGFNQAISRPKAVMALQVGGLAAKVPLSWLLAGGAPSLGLAPQGAVGCAAATVLVMWGQCAFGLWRLARDPVYRPFALDAPDARRLDRALLAALTRLGVPMGAAIMVEVTGFTMMAILIARLGTAAVAGHQVAVNLVSLMFMVQLGLANATTTLVAQRIGAGDFVDARRLGTHGVLFATAVAAALALVVQAARGPIVRLYTHDAAIAAVAVPLIAWLVVFHIADALQTMAAFTLRAWHVVTLPTVIYVLALWGVGLGGGSWLAFGGAGAGAPPLDAATPHAIAGAQAFWRAATAGLCVSAVALLALLAWVVRVRTREAAGDAAPAR